MQTKCIDFTCIHFNASCLLIYYFLTYYVSLWFLLNILLNNRLFYENNVYRLSDCAVHWARDAVRVLEQQNTFNWTRSEQLRLQPGLLQDTGCRLAASFSGRGCIKLMK